jgi:hypothetical protein
MKIGGVGNIRRFHRSVATTHPRFSADTEQFLKVLNPQRILSHDRDAKKLLPVARLTRRWKELAGLLDAAPAKWWFLEGRKTPSLAQLRGDQIGLDPSRAFHIQHPARLQRQVVPDLRRPI